MKWSEVFAGVVPCFDQVFSSDTSCFPKGRSKLWMINAQDAVQCNAKRRELGEAPFELWQQIECVDDIWPLKFVKNYYARNSDLNLGMRNICAKSVPKVLLYEQKDSRVKICLELLDCVRDIPNFHRRRIMGFKYDPETTGQNSECHTFASRRPKKARMNKPKIEIYVDCPSWL